MKRFLRILLILLILTALTGCASKRKSTQSVETVSIVSAKSELHSAETIRMIDTTKTERGKITITEVEFYPPTDDLIHVSGVSLMNIGVIDNVAVKSIRQTVIEQETESRGESGEVSSESVVLNEIVVIEAEKDETIDVAPVPDPKRWRYIFWILILVVIVFLYLKRKPIFNRITGK